MRKYFWVGFAVRKFRKLCRPGGGRDLNLVGGVVMVLPMRDGGRVPWETRHHYDHYVLTTVKLCPLHNVPSSTALTFHFPGVLGFIQRL